MKKTGVDGRKLPLLFSWIERGHRRHILSRQNVRSSQRQLGAASLTSSSISGE
jgi:hypothetical protein